ncbi:MAG: peroxiredoxin [Pseudomonadota bacterium]
MTTAPTEGDTAPNFNLPTDGDGTFALSDASGKTVVLYFYPRDDTSGCTKEAIGFSEAIGEFSAANAVVVGVSADSVKSHDKFKNKHDLKVILASDEEHTMLEDYGVWVEKSMYGKKYMGIERATFVIAGDGKISKVWRKVKVPGHVDDVLAHTKTLS